MALPAKLPKATVDAALALLGVTTEHLDQLLSVAITPHSVTVEQRRTDAAGTITTVITIDRTAAGPAADPNYYGPVALDPPART